MADLLSVVGLEKSFKQREGRFKRLPFKLEEER